MNPQSHKIHFVLVSLLLIFLTLCAFSAKSQYQFDGIHDDDALETLILNYVENGIVEFEVKCKKCPRRDKVYKYELIDDSLVVETNGPDTLTFVLRNNEVKWVPTEDDIREANKRRRYLEVENMDAQGRKVIRRFKATEDDTIFWEAIYITEYPDSNKLEKHFVPVAADFNERKITTYSYSPDSTRRVIYDKVGETWEVNLDETLWVDTTKTMDQLIIQKHEIRKSSITLNETPNMVETKTLHQNTFFFRKGLIRKVETSVSRVNLYPLDEDSYQLTFKPRRIRKSR